MSKEKVKVAFYWCASCGGCEEAIVDALAYLGDKMLDVLEQLEIVFWPVAVDMKRNDIEALANGEIVVSFINGAVRLSEQEDIVKLLRKKSKFVIAYGACSYTGGIPSLANLHDKERIFNYVYKEAPTVINPEGMIPKIEVEVPEGKLELPVFFNTVRALDQIINVDYYVPGCPPAPETTVNVLQTLLSGELPPKGSVIGAGIRALCEECPLNETKPEKILVTEFKRLATNAIKPDECFLVQGFVCMGPVTRGGCEARCIKVNRPCQGCYGPLDNIIDYGARAVSYLASILDVPPESEHVKKALENISDPVGKFYMFSLAKSLFKGKVVKR